MEDQNDRSRTSVNQWRRILHYFLCAAVLFEFIGFAYSYWPTVVGGNDWNIYARAFGAVSNDRDPYFISNLGFSNSFNYPVFWLYALRPAWAFAAPHAELYSFLALGFVVPLTVGLFLRISPNALLSLIAGQGLFQGFLWVLSTGNMQFVETAGILLSLILLHREKEKFAGLVFGVTCSMKLLPLMVCLLLILLRWTKHSRFLGAAGIGLAIVQGVSFLIAPTFFGSYWLQITGRIPDQHNPLAENYWGSDLYLLWTEHPMYAVAVGCLIVAALFQTWRKRSAGIAYDFSICVMLYVLLSPRGKPYLYASCGPALVYLLIRHRNSLLSALVLFVPFLSLYEYYNLITNMPFERNLFWIFSGFSMAALCLLSLTVLRREPLDEL